MIKFSIFFYESEDFSKGANLESLVSSLLSTGFQATNVGLAIHEINKMVKTG